MGGLAFLGSTAFATTTIFRDALTQHQSNETIVMTSEDRLTARERGYETVLQREPQNQVALEGLVNIRLQMNKVEDAVPPLQTLVKLYPERSDYQMLLSQVKQQVEESSVTQESSNSE